MVASFESVSTWRQERPTSTTPARRAVVDELAHVVTALSPRRMRVAIDGFTAAGKTTLGHELGAALRSLGRSTARASLDDFKHPWAHSREHGYDRITGDGYYRNAYDFTAARELLLRPAGAAGVGRVALCAWDPLTGVDHRAETVDLEPDTVLVVDSVFAFRPEYDEFWDYRVWVEVSVAVTLARGIARDTEVEGADGAAILHRERYHVAESIYVAEVNPRPRADAVVDNTDLAAPALLRRRPVT